MYGQVASGDFMWNETLKSPFVVVEARFASRPLIPDGSLILMTRSNDHFTSADVNGSPFENLTPCLSVHVHTVSAPFALQPVASSGCGLFAIPFGNPSRCWYIIRSTTDVPSS